MNTKIIGIIVAIVVVAMVVVAFLPLGKTIAGDFGFKADVVGSGALPFVNSNNTTTNGLSFKTLKQNTLLLGSKNMLKSGWGGWHITNTEISVESTMMAINTSYIMPFVQIQNTVSHNVTLNVSSYVSNGRIASYALQSGTTINAGYIVAIQNGTNYTLASSANNTTGNYVVGRGNLIPKTMNVQIPSSDYFDLYLSTIPNTTLNLSKQITTNNGIIVVGVVNLTI